MGSDRKAQTIVASTRWTMLKQWRNVCGTRNRKAAFCFRGVVWPTHMGSLPWPTKRPQLRMEIGVHKPRNVPWHEDVPFMKLLTCVCTYCTCRVIVSHTVDSELNYQ